MKLLDHAKEKYQQVKASLRRQTIISRGKYADVTGGRVYIGSKVRWSYGSFYLPDHVGTIVTISRYGSFSDETVYLDIQDDDERKQTWTVGGRVSKLQTVVKPPFREVILKELKQ